MRSQPMRVAIDLETTGLHAEQDTIIEIGAVKFAGEHVHDTLQSFVAPASALSYRIQRLTGIVPAQLRDAPALSALLPRLRAFLGDLPLVGHNIPFDIAFLHRAGLARRNAVIDTYELSSMLLPSLPGYTLAAVGEALGVPGGVYHRALADAELARQVLLALLQRLEALDIGALEALHALHAGPDWSPRSLLRAELHARGVRTYATGGAPATALGAQLERRLGMDPEVLALAIAAPAGHVPAAQPVTAAPAAPSEVATTELATAMRACFDDGGVLLAETGLSDESVVACLAPALRWAAQHQQRVLVATADTEALTHVARVLVPRALARADLSPADVPCAELAEHEGYSCLHRWFGSARDARDGALSRELARGLSKLMLWTRETASGMRAEVSLSAQEIPAWERTRAGTEFRDTVATCAYRRSGYCFVARARQAAENARVVITTHAALAADLAGTDTHLPPCARVLVLDAHLLEDELRRARSYLLDRRELLELLSVLGAVEHGGGRAGLLALAASHLAQAHEAARERAWFEHLKQTRVALDAFFHALRVLLGEGSGEVPAGQTASSEVPDHRVLRLGDQARQFSGWQGAAQCWTAFAAELDAVIRISRDAARLLQEISGSTPSGAIHGLVADLLATARWLEQLCACAAPIFGAGLPQNEVSWLRVPYVPATESGGGDTPDQRESRTAAPAPGQAPAEEAGMPASESDGTRGAAHAEAQPVPALHGALVQVGGLVESLYAPGHGLVLIGPALAACGEFEHTRGLLGLPAGAATCAVPLDCRAQTLIALPDDVPEPNEPHFQRQLDDTLIALARALGGRLVAIFPSHAALRASAAGIRRALERHDILTLAQGQDGSARQLWHTFRTQPRTVLLGAGVFWGGQEQREHPPACVVVTRLPFPALSDPLLAARAATWDDPQTQFVVPHAALKLRQALNGLAWSHHQRNSVLLFDRRIQSRSYGPRILATLPRCTQEQAPVSQLTERIVEWIGPA